MGDSRQSVRLVKGSHIVVRRLYEGEHAYALQHPDRRIVFVIPYQDDFTLIGTTDVPWQGEPGHGGRSRRPRRTTCARRSTVIFSGRSGRRRGVELRGHSRAVGRRSVGGVGGHPRLRARRRRADRARRRCCRCSAARSRPTGDSRNWRSTKLESQLGPMAPAVDADRAAARRRHSRWRHRCIHRRTYAGAGHFSTRRRRGVSPMPTARALRGCWTASVRARPWARTSAAA